MSVYSYVRAQFGQVVVPAAKILEAFGIEKEELKPDAPGTKHVVGYDYGITWRSSDGMPWLGYRQGFVETATAKEGQRKIVLGFNKVHDEDSISPGLYTPVRLIVQPLNESLEQFSVLAAKRSTHFFNDKGRMSRFLEGVKEWREHFAQDKSLKAVQERRR